MDHNKSCIQRVADSGIRLMVNSKGQCTQLMGWLGRHPNS